MELGNGGLMEKKHRDDGLPAIENANGSKYWWVNGKRHRDGGLPAVEKADGTKYWYVNGKHVPPPKNKKEYPKRPDDYVCSVYDDVCLICRESPWLPVKVESRFVFCQECIEDWWEVSRTNPLTRTIIHNGSEGYEKMF